ncbi:MAG: hypothetical protein WC919_04950 [Candidatus Paceibacterota bacterium]|jgi:hypothetical protein
MRYEELRRRYIRCQETATRLGDLKEKAASGNLSAARLADCRQEISRLDAELAENEKLFTHLHEIDDPAWRKLSRELDAALKEYQSADDPLSLRRIAKKFISTMSVLILGTWIIDGLRRR